MRRRWGIAVFASAVLGLGVVPLGFANHDAYHAFSGEWRLEPDGRLFLESVDAATGKATLDALSGEPGYADYWCQQYPNYYSGRFTTPTDHGPVAGCAKRAGSHYFEGLYRSDVLQPDEIGELDIQISYLKGGDATGFSTAPGTNSPHYGVEMRFLRHYAGDGSKESYTVDFDFSQHGIPNNLPHPVASKGDGALTLKRKPAVGETISADADASLTHQEGQNKLTIRLDGSGPYSLLQQGSEIKLLGDVKRSTDPDCPKGSKVMVKLVDHRLKSQDRIGFKGRSECSGFREAHNPGPDNRLKVNIYPPFFETNP